jgi:hypothetical protein
VAELSPGIPDDEVLQQANARRAVLVTAEDFKASNTLLLEADAEGLRTLAEKFRSLAGGTIDGLALHDLPFVEIHHRVQLIATRSAQDRGTRRVDVGNAFLWERTADGWEDAAEKLDVLTQYAEGHHYLDADEDQVVVQVSRGEYGDDWWRTHGYNRLKRTAP